ncbi:MAG: HNH endonuclease [Chloroflexota bacterium]|nr:HNH endonuclease [Chloroflexota bacterium]
MEEQEQEAQNRWLTAIPDELDRRVANLRARPMLTTPVGNEKPRQVYSNQVVYERDPAVKAWVLQQARGICELCRQPGPFVLPSGEQYLEVHHVHPLAEGGPDTIQNAVALCPNCHRLLHLAVDAEQYLAVLYAQVNRLN